LRVGILVAYSNSDSDFGSDCNHHLLSAIEESSGVFRLSMGFGASKVHESTDHVYAGMQWQCSAWLYTKPFSHISYLPISRALLPILPVSCRNVLGNSIFLVLERAQMICGRCTATHIHSMVDGCVVDVQQCWVPVNEKLAEKISDVGTW